VSEYLVRARAISSVTANSLGKVTAGHSGKAARLTRFYLPLSFAIALELLRTRRIRLFNQNLAL